MKYFLTLSISFLFSLAALAQTDSLIFKDGSYLVGELISKENSVLTIETSYSKDDFTTEWSEIKEIYTENLFLLSTIDGRRMYGKINSTGDNNLVIELADGSTESLTIDEVFTIKSLDQAFLDRLYAGIDLGFTVTQAQNQRQFSVRSQAGYLGEKWSVDFALNNIISSRDDVEDIRRGDGNITVKYVFPRQWFLVAQNEFLYNNEQLLDLRSNTMFGVGRYLIRGNSLYLSVYSGASYNNEDYEGEGNDRQSGEAWVGGELNIFDIEDFSLLVNVIAYPSLTESGRVRVDNRIDLQYDLPMDFYIKTGFTLNYDNQPIEGATQSDYIWQTTFGWSW